MFNTLLIANRGEIACRIIKTCQRLGIKTIAIYSTVDENARHVRLADEAYWVGPPPSKESYLSIETIIEIAKKSKAEAIHPGYGFLSEHVAFAAACEKAGICFVGPKPHAIKIMGSKSEAKKQMALAKVPLIPGYHGDLQSEEDLLKEAKKIGFPILLKASCGGGGKGLRAVFHEKEFHSALKSAKREALASFGNEDMLIEKYLEAPRHIEVQIFMDQYGEGVYLFERDCSIQRRHQKIIEEAPAPHISETLRKNLGSTALMAAKAIEYTGAGTVEFLVDEKENFYFMEMNTRLQVEHPVTEMITGLDLVEWQLRIAAKEPLPQKQDSLSSKGHAIEARIYAEDPEQDFLPSIGKILYLREPSLNEHVRIDTGVETGDMISPYYDAMISKLIVWGEHRESALRHLQTALKQYQIFGVATNLSYLTHITEQPDFQKGAFTTHFIKEHESSLLEKTSYPSKAYALGALFLLFQQQETQKKHLSEEPDSPWRETDSWKLNLPHQQTFTFEHHKEQISVMIQIEETQYKISVEKETFIASIKKVTPEEYHISLNGETFQIRGILHENLLFISGNEFHYTLFQKKKTLQAFSGNLKKDTLSSPMPGTLVAIETKPGDFVKKGTPLLIVEAMKMEHVIRAPQDGEIKEIYFSLGDAVEEGVELISFHASADLNQESHSS